METNWEKYYRYTRLKRGATFAKIAGVLFLLAFLISGNIESLLGVFISAIVLFIFAFKCK